MPFTVAMRSDAQRCCHAPPGAALASSTTKRLGRVRVARDRHEAAALQVVRGREPGLPGADDGDLHLGCIHMHGNLRAGPGIPADPDG